MWTIDNHSGLDVFLDDNDLWKPASQKGKVEKFIYHTHWYSGTSSHNLDKTICIYTPPGYDKNKKYDVLVLLPGMDMPASCYLSRAHRYSSELYSVQFANLLDNTINNGYIKPAIMVTFPYYGATTEGHPEMSLDGNQIINEVRYDVLPYIIQRYSTYASGSDSKSISEVREHFGIFGFSYTSTMILKYIMPECIDLFGYFGASSVFYSDISASATKVNSKLNNYPVYWLYVGCGDRDDAHNQTVDMYNEWINLVQEQKDVSELVVLKDTGHDARTYDTAIYNCMTRFFK